MRSLASPRSIALLPALAAFLGVLLLVAGCSGTDPESAAGRSTDLGTGEGAEAAAPERAAEDSGGDDDAAAEDGRSSGGASDGGKSVSRVPIRERAVIRTGQLVVRTKDAEAAADRASGLVNGTDGFVANEQSTTDAKGEVTGVQLVLRVPVDRFDNVVASVKKLGKVRAAQTDATDVTEDLVDVESRITSQKRSIDRLRTLLSRATTVGEVIQVESELATREAELESLQSRQATLASQTALSTLTATFEEPRRTPEPEPKDDDRGFLAGLGSGWDAFVTTVQVALTVVGALVPFLVAALILLGPPLWYLRRTRARRRTPDETPPPAPAS